MRWIFHASVLAREIREVFLRLSQIGRVGKSILWKLLRWVFFHFDAESVHRAVVQAIRVSISFEENTGFSMLKRIGGETGLSREGGAKPPIVFGLPFRSRLGLAAGFDKDAEILSGLPDLGFGFAEIGTVTPRPQPGNPRPRLFRDVEKEAIFNRMGFNGQGAEVVAKRLADAKLRLPRDFRVGVNLGKNKDTSLEEAWKDYMAAAKYFENLADYLVVNVSSPNTPGLRSLQNIEFLKPIVGKVLEVVSRWTIQPPLLLKIAPELLHADLEELVPAMELNGVNGWVLTNTLGGTYSGARESLSGGWSGRLLASHSRKSLEAVRRVSQKPIISVGGIMTVEEGASRISAGASLIQLYTGWIFGGPGFPAELGRYLQQMKR